MLVADEKLAVLKYQAVLELSERPKACSFQSFFNCLSKISCLLRIMNSAKKDCFHLSGNQILY